jgi:DNA-binding ferritin-like protein
MPTAETHTNPVVPDFEAAAERAREANDRLAEAGRKVTTAYLDSVEKYVAGLAKFERKVAEQSQVEVVASLLDTHAKLTEEVVKASVSAARELVTANAS